MDNYFVAVNWEKKGIFAGVQKFIGLGDIIQFASLKKSHTETMRRLVQGEDGYV